MPEQNERTTAPVSKTLGVIMESYACRHEGAVYMHFSHGRVIDRLAQRYEWLLLCLPLQDGQPDVSRDHRLQSENIEIVPQPFYTRSFQAVRHPWGIARAYIRTCRKSDRLFLRGMLPYVGILYATAFLLGRRMCHWIVGNPLACLGGNRRIGRWMDALSIVYAWQDRLVTRVGRWLTRGWFVCNGQELGRLFRSPKTLITVSSTVAEGEFHERQNTCQGPVIRLLYVGFVRPEKGLEYLLEAVSRMRMDRPLLDRIPDLTEKQKKEIAGLRQKQQDEMKKQREEMSAKIKNLRESHRAKIMNLLTDEQKKWLEENTTY
jgi:glycosyltransferase involved in cell wall biosynthesis